MKLAKVHYGWVICCACFVAVSYTHLDVYKRQSLLLSGRENCGEDQLRRDGHDNGRLSGTLSERSFIYEQSESFHPVLWTSD